MGRQLIQVMILPTDITVSVGNTTMMSLNDEK